MSYRQPIQQRAIQTENAFLTSIDLLFRQKGFEGTTVEEISRHAGLTRASFLARFGSKEGALLRLYSRYCDDAMAAMMHIIQTLDEFDSLHDVLKYSSTTLEKLVIKDFASNRAMHEHFLKTLEPHNLTKVIFKECVRMMENIQAHFLPEGSYTQTGAWASAQLLVTINFNASLKAMPALPRDLDDRHDLIADILITSLQR